MDGARRSSESGPPTVQLLPHMALNLGRLICANKPGSAADNKTLKEM